MKAKKHQQTQWAATNVQQYLYHAETIQQLWSALYIIWTKHQLPWIELLCESKKAPAKYDCTIQTQNPT